MPPDEAAEKGGKEKQVKAKEAEAKLKLTPEEALAKLQEVQKRAKLAQVQAKQGVEKIRGAHIEIFRDLVALRGLLFPEDLLPHLHQALDPLPAVPLLPATPTPDEQKTHAALTKLHAQLSPGHIFACELVFNWPQNAHELATNERAQKDFASDLEQLQKHLVNFSENLQAYRKQRENLLRLDRPATIRLQTSLRLLEIPGNPPQAFTVEQFEQLLADIEQTPPPRPDQPGHPLYRRLTEAAAPGAIPSEQRFRLSVIRQWLDLYGTESDYADLLGDLHPEERKKVMASIPSYNLGNLRRTLRDFREAAIARRPILNEEAASRGFQDQLLQFLLNRHEYDEFVGTPRAAESSKLQALGTMITMLAARMPFDRRLEAAGWSWPRHLHPREAWALSPAEFKNLTSMQEQIRKNLVARGYSESAARRLAGSLEDLNRVMHGHPLRNFWRDCIRHNVIDGVLLMLMMHASPNKMQTAMQWFAVLGGNAVISYAGWRAERFLLTLAQRSSSCAATARLLGRFVGNQYVQIGAAIALLCLGHEHLEAGIKWVDENVIPQWARRPVETAGMIIAVPANILERWSLALGITQVNPEHDAMGFLGQERLSDDLGIASGGAGQYHNTIEGWNTYVERAIKAESNPILARIMERERIDGGRNGNWARRQAARLLRQMTISLPRERQLTERLRARLILGETEELGGVAIATRDGETVRNDRDLTVALRDGHLRRVRDVVLALPDTPENQELKNLWNAYSQDLTAMAKDVSIYNYLRIYDRRQWLGVRWQQIEAEGGNYEPTTFAREGVLLDIAYMLERREATVYDPARYPGLTQEQFGKHLARATVREEQFNPLQLLNVFQTLETIFVRISEGIRNPAAADAREWTAEQLIKVRTQIQSLVKQMNELLEGLDDRSAARKRFNESLEPVRKIVLRYRERGNPTLKELEEVRRLITQAVLTLNHEVIGVRFRLPGKHLQDAMGIDQHWEAFGEWNDWGTNFVILAFAANYRNPRTGVFYSRPDILQAHRRVPAFGVARPDFIRVHCTQPPGAPTASFFAFYCSGPDRSRWRVWILQKRETIGAREGGIATVRDEEIPYEQFSKEFGAMASALEPRMLKHQQEQEVVLKTAIAKQAKADIEEKKKQSAREKQLNEARGKAHASRGFIEIDNDDPRHGREYRTRRDNQMVVTFFQTSNNFRRNVAQGQVIPAFVGPGGEGRTPDFETNTVRQPRESDVIEFRFETLDGREARPAIRVNSYADFLQLSDANKKLFLELAFKPMEGGPGARAMWRLIRLFPHQFAASGHDRYVCRERLQDLLWPLYMMSSNKEAFLQVLWNKIVENGAVINADSVAAIVKYFRNPQRRSDFGMLGPSLHAEPDIGFSDGQIGSYAITPVVFRFSSGGPQLERTEFDQWKEMYQMRDFLRNTWLVTPRFESMIPEGFTCTADRGRNAVAMLQFFEEQREKSLPPLAKRVGAFYDRQAAARDAIERFLTYAQAPQQLKTAPAKVFHELFRQTSAWRKTVDALRKEQPQIANEVRSEVQKQDARRRAFAAIEPLLSQLQTPYLDRETYRSVVLLNEEENKRYLSVALGGVPDGLSIAEQLLKAADAAAVSGTDAGEAARKIIENMLKQFTAQAGRIEQYRKELDARRRPTLDARERLAKAASGQPITSSSYTRSEAPPLREQRSYRPLVFTRGDFTAEGTRVFQESLTTPDHLPGTRYRWDNVQAIFFEAVGPETDRRYLITFAYRLRGGGIGPSQPRFIYVQRGARVPPGTQTIEFGLPEEVESPSYLQNPGVYQDVVGQDFTARDQKTVAAIRAGDAAVTPEMQYARALQSPGTFRLVRFPDGLLGYVCYLPSAGCGVQLVQLPTGEWSIRRVTITGDGSQPVIPFGESQRTPKFGASFMKRMAENPSTPMTLDAFLAEFAQREQQWRKALVMPPQTVRGSLLQEAQMGMAISRLLNDITTAPLEGSYAHCGSLLSRLSGSAIPENERDRFGNLLGVAAEALRRQGSDPQKFLQEIRKALQSAAPGASLPPATIDTLIQSMIESMVPGHRTGLSQHHHVRFSQEIRQSIDGMQRRSEDPQTMLEAVRKLCPSGASPLSEQSVETVMDLIRGYEFGTPGAPAVPQIPVR